MTAQADVLSYDQGLHRSEGSAAWALGGVLIQGLRATHKGAIGQEKQVFLSDSHRLSTIPLIVDTSGVTFADKT